MSILFEPTKIGKLELRNRFIRSATHFSLADPNGFIGGPSVALMKMLAGNDIGLIITGHTYILKSGQRSKGMNGIQDDEHIDCYREMTRAVHEAGGHIAMQINHSGVEAWMAALSGEDYLTVSLTERMPDLGRLPKEMDEEDIWKIIKAFGRAARRAQEAGFDGVQIHGAHGYLVSQFLSPLTNKRRDRWGGSIENRMRFVIEVTRAIKKSVDDDFPVMIKLGCRDYLDEKHGLTIDEGALVAQALEKEGISLIEISFGISGPLLSNRFGITSPEKEGTLIPEARIMRQAVSCPLSLVTGLRSLGVIERIVSEDGIDFISISRPLIREPGLIRRWKDGDTRPAECISCKGQDHESSFGCYNVDENGELRVYCRQLKKIDR